MHRSSVFLFLEISLARLAPFNRDSGRYQGKRPTWGDRAVVRSMLYMATLVVVRHNRLLRAHYEHLLAKVQAQESRPDCLYPKTTDLSQCHTEREFDKTLKMLAVDSIPENSLRIHLGLKPFSLSQAEPHHRPRFGDRST